MTGVLPRLQPATGPHPVPAPLAAEFRRAGGHASIGLRAQPGQRLHVIEWPGRNGFGYDEMLLLEYWLDRAKVLPGRSDGDEAEPQATMIRTLL
ncbi:hypothetical protein [Bradyrhizobium sp.]|uniref:hypothetical protein n=1 Tax=Bradyrhizobium sp. TaxID=376 RepID=UPI003C3DBBB4